MRIQRNYAYSIYDCMQLTRVSRETFYAAIGPLDVHPVAMDTYPYTSEFKTREGRLVGIAASHYTTPGFLWPITTEYYLVRVGDASETRERTVNENSTE